MYFKIKKIINIVITLPIIYIIFFEIFFRIIVFLFTLNSSIFFYGLDKNIILNLHSIKNREFFITNNGIKLKKNSNLKSNNNEIWVFGGSTSNKGFCDSKSTSWVDLISTDLTKVNFSKNGINSSFSLNLLKNEIKNQDPPKIILWANKVNEVLHSKRSNNPKNKILYLINSIKLTLKENLVLFYFFDEFAIRLFDKFEINIRNEKIELDRQDYEYSAKKYLENTIEAINMAELYKVEKFFIISIFNRLNMQNLETKFYDYYFSEVKKIIENKKNIYFINTKNYLKPIEKNESLFCDSMHHNYQGKFIIAKIISKFINGYK